MTAAPGPRDPVRLETSAVTGLASFVTAPDGGPLTVHAGGGRAVPDAMDFMIQYGDLFGVTNPQRQLTLDRIERDRLGTTHTTYRQTHEGVPVFSGVLKVHQNAAGGFNAANGDFYPISSKLSITPTLSEADAVGIAAAELNLATSNLETAELVIVDPGWYGDPPMGAHLAYYIILSGDVPETAREAFFVDAHTGGVLDRWNLIQTAKNRKIHNNLAGSNCCYSHSGTRCDDNDCAQLICGEIGDDYCCITQWDSECAYYASYVCGGGGLCLPGPLTRTENQEPVASTDVNRAYDYYGDTYDYYFRAFGRDSINGAGMGMVATVNSQAPGCPNAYWSGGRGQMVFCPGLVVDDVVGHELTHGVTDYTADLIYQNQSGQLNESFSDVFGELIDLFNGDAGFAGAPGGVPWGAHPTGPGRDTPNTLRTSTCSYAGATLVIDGPADIAGEYPAGLARFGPWAPVTGLTGQVVAAVPAQACTALTNSAQVSGKIALVDRGGTNCGFALKVKNAQNAGAIAVLVANNAVGPLLTMTGDDPSITIPSLFISLNDGARIRTKLATGTVTVSLVDTGYADGVRWLTGEDAITFGGAIRDMWNPPCYGDPDRANSPLQVCSPDDGGGVHSGSGIPNHAFAMLVDGTTFNGYTINGIGPIKAAAVWYRALTRYLTPAADFRDAYAAFLHAAADLVNTKPLDPRTGAVSDSIFTAADASQVAIALRAAEMDTTGRCGAEKKILETAVAPVCPLPHPVFQDTFEAGENGWTVSHSAPYPDAHEYDWVLKSAGLPSGRTGTVWFCEDRNSSCSQTSPNESALHSLISPPITLPANLVDPGMSFTHYINSELSYDGGNISYRIGTGSWQRINPSAIAYNSYNLTLVYDADNGNPLAEQWAWTGSGGWGTTVVKLSGLMSAGQTVQFKFDFGKDFCNSPSVSNTPGWFIDDFAVFSCDCNTNGISDATDITAGTSEDCDANGAPDDCELVASSGVDCNGNGKIDSCELDAGDATDCDGNRAIDSCEISANSALDSDNNGVLDVCQPDMDGDGACNTCELCPNDPAKTVPGNCGCGVADTDSDGDGKADCVDGCPGDKNKTSLGVCGCGVADTDTDGDGVPDCNDQCPNEQDGDADGDGLMNCAELCPYDSAKTDPGLCGCGVVEGDTDGDGTADCADRCPGDPNKTAPSTCGCSVPETDTDGDGAPDCIDGTPTGAAQALEIAGPDTLLIGTQGQYTAAVLFADGSRMDVSDRVSWRVLDIVVQSGRGRLSSGDTIDAAGLVTVSAERTGETTLSVLATFDDGPTNLQGAKLIEVLLEEPVEPPPSDPIRSDNDDSAVDGGSSPGASATGTTGQAPCGVGLLMPMTLGLLGVGALKLARARRVR